MSKRFACAGVIFAALLATPRDADARFIASWPYEKLFKEADLVVFAEPIKTEASDDKPPEHSWNYEFAGQNTTFKVVHTLKGKAATESIQLLHFKFGALKPGVKPDSFAATIIIDGPMLVAFRSKPVIVTTGKEKHVLPAPEYLLFLKKRKDGRYEAVSGQIDPAQSIREVGEAPGTLLTDGKRANWRSHRPVSECG